MYRVGVKCSVILKFQSVVPSSKELYKMVWSHHAETLGQVAALCFISSKRVSLVA